MYKVIRDVSRQECPWLGTQVKAGTLVYKYHGYTYGVMGGGVAVTLEKDKTPFFELPYSALKKVKL